MKQSSADAGQFPEVPGGARHQKSQDGRQGDLAMTSLEKIGGNAGNETQTETALP